MKLGLYRVVKDMWYTLDREGNSIYWEKLDANSVVFVFRFDPPWIDFLRGDDKGSSWFERGEWTSYLEPI